MKYLFCFSTAYIVMYIFKHILNFYIHIRYLPPLKTEWETLISIEISIVKGITVYSAIKGEKKTKHEFQGYFIN